MTAFFQVFLQGEKCLDLFGGKLGNTFAKNILQAQILRFVEESIGKCWRGGGGEGSSEFYQFRVW